MSRFKIRTDRGLYRSRNGVVAGVCRGLAEYFDFSVFWLRSIVVIIFLLSGIWPVVALYFLATLLMKPEPARPFSSPGEEEFYDSYVRSPQGAASRLRRRFESLDRRIRRMEDTVTSREFDWERKMGA
ncbi:MAG: envelope stress response membrane protein PspC [Desulfobacterales bacterium]|nr:envelope stress response membrane protein PspC [Desulfobacterales bacterium]